MKTLSVTLNGLPEDFSFIDMNLSRLNQLHERLVLFSVLLSKL
jgi:hypothetical protein